MCPQYGDSPESAKFDKGSDDLMRDAGFSLTAMKKGKSMKCHAESRAPPQSTTP
jgi:hypothetical protein